MSREMEKQPDLVDLPEGKEEPAEVEPEVEVLDPEEGPADAAEVHKQLQEQTEKAADYYDRLLRLQAEFENFRRRTRQEKEELAKYAAERLMVELLQVLDNFERALSLETKGDNQEAILEGMEMVYRQFKDVLAKEGLTVIPAVGEQFDPNKHDAVMQEESSEQPDNTVIEEMRRGYMLKDKVIRPAMVKVAK